MAPAAAIEPDAQPFHRGGSGEPLVLVHGGGGTRRLWRTTIPLLEPHHDVLAVTMRGHFGGVPLAVGVEANVTALADGVEEDMDEAGFETAHVAGGSLGGWVALELARRGRARTAIAIAPAGGWHRGDAAVRRVARIYRVLTSGSRMSAPFARFWASRPRLRKFAAWHHFAHPERMSPDDFAYMIVGAARAESLREGLTRALDFEGAEGLDEIDCPVLLAFPEHDLILPRRRYGERFVREIPRAEVVDLPGTGHAAMVDDPELVARTIVGFTRRHAETSAGA